MMNIKQNKGLFALLLLAVLTACTSEDNITTSKQLIEVGGDKLKIVINEEPFDVETTAQTRAGGVAQAIPAGTVDLGDGLEAEVSISQGTPAPKTRATVVSDGHYNIYAYDANTNQMLIGPNKKLSGNVVGGVFTPDAGSRLELEAGTYKFVCCTDGVNLDPTYGTGSLGINVKKEMIGATAPITLSGDGQQIVFLMYHRESRFRFRLIGYTNQLIDVKAQIGIYMGSYRHNYMKIPTGFQGPSTAIGWDYYAEEQPIQATPARQSTAYPLANEFESDGYSFLSCVDCYLCFNLSGTIYGKTVNIQATRVSPWRNPQRQRHLHHQPQAQTNPRPLSVPRWHLRRIGREGNAQSDRRGGQGEDEQRGWYRRSHQPSEGRNSYVCLRYQYHYIG